VLYSSFSPQLCFFFLEVPGPAELGSGHPRLILGRGSGLFPPRIEVPPPSFFPFTFAFFPYFPSPFAFFAVDRGRTLFPDRILFPCAPLCKFPPPHLSCDFFFPFSDPFFPGDLFFHNPGLIVRSAPSRPGSHGPSLDFSFVCLLGHFEFFQIPFFSRVPASLLTRDFSLAPPLSTVYLFCALFFFCWLSCFSLSQNPPPCLAFPLRPGALRTFFLSGLFPSISSCY